MAASLHLRVTSLQPLLPWSHCLSPFIWLPSYEDLVITPGLSRLHSWVKVSHSIKSASALWPCKVTHANVLGIRVWTSLGKRLACCMHLIQNGESCEFGTGSQPRAPCSHRGSEQRRVSRRKGAAQWHRRPREEPRWDAGPAPEASMCMGLPSAAPLPGLELTQVGSMFLAAQLSPARTAVRDPERFCSCVLCLLLSKRCFRAHRFLV